MGVVAGSQRRLKHILAAAIGAGDVALILINMQKDAWVAE